MEGYVDVLVARQAIFDRRREVYAYELLFRSDAARNQFDGTEAATATLQVLSNSLLSIGAEKLLGGKKAFVNFDHRLLSTRVHLALPRESLVIEILETVIPTADLVALCRSIRDDGYSLALDDFTDGREFADLARLASVIKIDMRQSSQQEQEQMLRTYQPRGVLMLAEKVETHAEFEWALKAGYDLFQGYFFARPVIVRSQHIPAVKTTCLQLLREMQKCDLNFTNLQSLIRGDLSLTFQLLRYVNSALFAREDKIDSIATALAALGEENIRRWVALATLPTLATNKPGELVKLSLVRARFCERLAQLSHYEDSNQAFLMGLFSLIDALVDQPIAEALQSIQLEGKVANILLGHGAKQDLLTSLFELISAYEPGNWDEVERLSSKCGILPAEVGQAYLDATSWVEQFSQIAIA